MSGKDNPPENGSTESGGKDRYATVPESNESGKRANEEREESQANGKPSSGGQSGGSDDPKAAARESGEHSFTGDNE